MKLKFITLFIFCACSFGFAQQRKSTAAKNAQPVSSAKSINLPSAKGLISFLDSKTYLYGYKDSVSERIVIPAIYQKTEPFISNSALVQLSKAPGAGKWQLINAKGQPVTNQLFDRISQTYNQLIVVGRAEKFGIYTRAGKELAPVIYQMISPFKEDGFALMVENESKKGWIHESGLRVKGKGAPHDGFLYVTNEAEKWGLFSLKTRQIALPIKYDFVSYYKDGFANIKENGKFGLINDSCKIVIPCEYEKMATPNQGLVWVLQNGKNGFLDVTGKVVIPIIYDETYQFEGYFAKVKLNGKYGLINKKGEVVLPINYDYIGSTNSPRVKINIGGKLIDNSYIMGGLWGLINSVGKVLIEPKYSFIWDYSEGLALVLKGGTYNASTKVFDGGKYGYIDNQGVEVIAPQFDVANSFKNGKAAVRLGVSSFNINTSGKVAY